MITPTVLAAVLTALLAPPQATYEQHLAEWRKSRTVEAAGPDGWTTVVALHWLQPGRTRVGSGAGVEARLPPGAPALVGTLRVDGTVVTFEAAPAVDVRVKDTQVTSVAMKADETTLHMGSYTFLVIERAGRLALRVRDRDSQPRRRFKGIDYFPVDSGKRLRARFVPFSPAKTVTVVNVIGDAVEFESPGQVVFTLAGAEQRLDAMYETREKKDLWIIFRDRTSGVSTYPAGRYLHAPLPANGVVDLDFNVAYNPPCAFTDFATCPIPPKQNWLKVPIEAGEKNYTH